MQGRPGGEGTRTPTADVLIIGASTRAAAHSAIRAGMVPVCSDLYGDTDLQSAAAFHPITDYPTEFVDVVRGYDLPVLFTGALENNADLLKNIEATRTVWGTPADVVRRVRDPFRLSSALRAAGLSAPMVRPVTEGLDLTSDWLRKPVCSGGGRGITPGTTPSTDTDSDWYLQQYIPGPSLAAVFLADEQRCVCCGVTLQFTGVPALGAAKFAYAGSLGPVTVRESFREQIERVGSVLNTAFGMRGLFGVDFVAGEGDVWPVEVNPRYTASTEVIELGSGESLLAAHRAVFVAGEIPDVSTCGRSSIAKVILFASRAVDAPALAEFRMSSEAWLADVPAAGTPVPKGGPICSVLARGNSPVDALQVVADAAERTALCVGLSAEDLEQQLARQWQALAPLVDGPSASHAVPSQ